MRHEPNVDLIRRQTAQDQYKIVNNNSLISNLNMAETSKAQMRSPMAVAPMMDWTDAFEKIYSDQ